MKKGKTKLGTAKSFIKTGRLKKNDGKPDRKIVYKKPKKERKKEEKDRKIAFLY